MHDLRRVTRSSIKSDTWPRQTSARQHGHDRHPRPEPPSGRQHRRAPHRPHPPQPRRPPHDRHLRRPDAPGRRQDRSSRRPPNDQPPPPPSSTLLLNAATTTIRLARRTCGTQHAPARTSKGITCGARQPRRGGLVSSPAPLWSTDDTIRPTSSTDPCYARFPESTRGTPEVPPDRSHPGEHHTQLGPWNDTHRALPS